MKKNWMAVFCFTLLFLLSAITQTMATTIVYTPTDNGSGNYTLDFTVTNTQAESIQWLKVYFGQTTNGLVFSGCDNFSGFLPDDLGVHQPAGWDSYSFESWAIDTPGQFNADIFGSDGASIASGGTGAGFSVSFDMTAGSYDGLYFEVGKFSPLSFDPDGYVIYGPNGENVIKLADGYTQAAGGPPAVPEPTTVALFLLGLATLGLAKKKKIERD